MNTLDQRKAALRRDIERVRREADLDLARKERHLAELESMPDFEDLPDGTVASLAINYSQNSKSYVVIAYKVEGKWHLTGASSPNGVDSGELGLWVTSQGRRLQSVDLLAEVQAAAVKTIDLGGLLANSGVTLKGAR